VSAYLAHIPEVQAACTRALEVAAERGEAFDSIVFHAGSLATYHADDLEIPFRAGAHFLRFAPVPGPDHLLVFRPGVRTRLIRAVASCFWHASAAAVDDDVAAALDVIEAQDPRVVFRGLADVGRCAFVGEDGGVAGALDIALPDTNPAALLAALDWERGLKTEYEVDCIREAQQVASLGHVALRERIEGCPSEFELHIAYLTATRQLEAELPYPSIIAWDEASAVLHYQHRRKQRPHPARCFLVDAGVRVRGYASDITRTYCRNPGDSDIFATLLDGMEALQQTLVDAVRPGVDFVDLHRLAESEIATLLRDAGILRVGVEQAREQRIVFAFFPHGLGHHLGLQVHDVGGQQADPQGTLRPPPDDCPHLRTTRRLASRHVITIEPGLYFIPSLLDPLRGNDAINWALVDRLTPMGGIRIEDDVLVTEGEPHNLTRLFLPGH